jgi:VanZ family protein
VSRAFAPSLRALAAPAVSAWLPVLLWAILIAGFSTDPFGTSLTFVWVERIARFLRPDVGAEVVFAIHFAVRKLAHLTEYAIFALLLVRAFRSGSGPSPRSPLAAAIVVASLYSLGDEAHQSLSSARSGALADCAIDSAGAAAGALLTRIRGNARRRSPPCTRSLPR